MPWTVELSMTYQFASSLDRPEAVMYPLPMVCYVSQCAERSARGPVSSRDAPGHQRHIRRHGTSGESGADLENWKLTLMTDLVIQMLCREQLLVNKRSEIDGVNGGALTTLSSRRSTMELK